MCNHRTPQDQVAAMNRFCDELASHPEIRQAYVDDWGRFGNFQIQVEPVVKDRHSTNRLSAVVRKQLAGVGAYLREVFPPDRVYCKKYSSRSERMVKTPCGWTRDTWMVDVDFQSYDADSNRFSETSTKNPCSPRREYDSETVDSQTPEDAAKSSGSLQSRR